MLKKIIAVLMVVCILICFPVFSASADGGVNSVSILVNGGGTVTINGREYLSDQINCSFATGDSVSMTATPDEGYEFLYWLNRETNRIISWDTTVTFMIGSYAKYSVVFDVDETVAAAQSTPVHTIIYLSEGGNVVSFQQNVPIGDTSFISDVPASGLFVSGKSWKGWDKSVDVVAGTGGRVIVRPEYEISADFDITYTIGDTTRVVESAPLLSRVTLIAPEVLDGEEFSYWIARAKDVNSEDEIASFYSTYEFVVTGNVTLEAIYGESYSWGAAARIAGDLPSFDDSSISIYAEHSVVPGYVIVQTGMLITKDERVGNFPDKFTIEMIDPEADPPVIYKRTATDPKLAGSFRVSIGNWVAEDGGTYTYFPRVFARAYVIAMDQNGTTRTFYSQPYCCEYILDTGVIDDNNNDDPFG